MKRIDNLQVYHLEHYNKKFFQFQFDEGLLIVKNTKNQAKADKVIPLSTILQVKVIGDTS